MSMARMEDVVEIPALGRPFQLGMLYDCRKDALIPGVTLWHYSSLQKDLTTSPQPNTDSEILASDTINDKASALDISANLKASFLGKLVEVGGSAKYLQDTKKSKQQARVTAQYKATTQYKQLTMSHLGIQNVSYPAVFEHGTATHVVTAILYGAQAFFVFDREVSSTETVKDIEDSLQATLMKEISIGGGAEVKYDEEKEEIALGFKCKFHGDFSLERNPVTFQDAIQVYKSLPKMLGKDGEKAMPMRIWLYPLTKLDTKAATMVREISLALTFETQKVLQGLNDTEMQSNDLANDSVAEAFPEIKRKIEQFKDRCNQHRQRFQEQLARVLPSIRGGGQEEKALEDILTSVNRSPFSSQRLGEFLEAKEREINMVRSYLTILSEIQVISTKNKLEEIVLHPQNVYVVSFTLTSLHEEDSFLLSLQDWLQEHDFPGSAKSTRSTPGVKKGKEWFEDQEKTQNARRTAKAIETFFTINRSNESVRFVVASFPDVDTPGASIYLYEEGELVSKNLELPSKPLPLLISEVRHDRVQLKFQPAEYGRAAISSYLVEYKIAGEDNWKTVRTEDAGVRFLLKDLLPNTEYQFQYAACCKPGRSKLSDPSPPIKTLPTSPPEKVRTVTTASSAITVTWMSPSIVASGVVVQEYKVEYRTVEAGDGKGQWTEKRTWRRTELYPIEGLKPQTAYRVRVSAVCDNGALSVPSEEVEVSTSLEEEDAGNVAHQFLHESSRVEGSQPSVFALPLYEVASDPSLHCSIYWLGEANEEVANKAILVLGATESGKAALINGMINYILGVQWEDDFRFRLIEESAWRGKAGRKLFEYKAYVVHHRKGFRIPYSLTILDPIPATPEVVEKEIRGPPNEHSLDAICFVTKAGVARLADPRKPIFDTLVSVLEKDLKDNLQPPIACSAGGTPPGLEAVQEADLPRARDESGTPQPFRVIFSSLFANHLQESVGSHRDAERFWHLSMESMKDFFDSLNVPETKMITWTLEVPKEHQ